MGTRRVILWLLAAGALVVGVWAQFAPASFYDSFAFGRGWVALDGPYNEHLIRDVGGLQLALAVVTAAAAVTMRADLIRVAATATLVFALPHLIYHASHLQPFGVADAVAQVSSIGLQVLAALWLAASPLPVRSGRALVDQR